MVEGGGGSAGAGNKIALKQAACAANGRIMISKHKEDEEKYESHPSERKGSEGA